MRNSGFSLSPNRFSITGSQLLGRARWYCGVGHIPTFPKCCVRPGSCTQICARFVVGWMRVTCSRLFCRWNGVGGREGVSGCLHPPTSDCFWWRYFCTFLLFSPAVSVTTLGLNVAMLFSAARTFESVFKLFLKKVLIVFWNCYNFLAVVCFSVKAKVRTFLRLWLNRMWACGWLSASAFQSFIFS